MTLDIYRESLAFESAPNCCLSKIHARKNRIFANSISESRHRLVVIIVAILVLFSLPTNQTKADDPPVDDRPVIMCQTLAPYRMIKDEEGKESFHWNYTIFRELGRQLVLNVFREEFGLPTRDESLFEPIDLDSDHLFEIDVRAIEKNFQLDIRHEDKLVFSQTLPLNLADNEAHRCATIIENKIKPGLVAAIEKLGYRKDDRNFEPTSEYLPLPDAIEQELRSMNHISQFQALRKIHGLNRKEGPTVSRLCGLVRGYSNLSQLMASTLDCRSEVFAARAMLYGRRLRRFSKNSLHAIVTDAYSEVMLGYPNRASGHTKKMAERFAEKKLEPFDWLPLLDDYINYRDSKIEEVMGDEDSSLSEIAALLRFRSGLQSEIDGASVVKEQAGRIALEVIPTCQWIYDRLAYNAGVSSSHRWTAVAPKELANQLRDYLPDCDELPDDTKELVDEIIDDGRFDFYSIAKVANQLVEDAKADRTEPSLAVLGRNIEAWNVMHVVRIAYFYRYSLAIDPSQILDELEVVYENHPSAILVRAIGIKANVSIQDPDYIERLGGALKKFEYKHPNRMADYKILERLHPLFEFANDVSLTNAKLMANEANSIPEYNYVTEAAYNIEQAYYMGVIARRSPVRMSVLFTVDWENNKQDFDQWIADYRESPAVSLTAARVYRDQFKDPKKAAEFYEEYLKKFPDASVLKELAQMQFDQSESDEWQKTLVRVFRTEDLGLQHAETAGILAATLMHEGDYDAALEWAERANESGSSFGMWVLQQCLTGLGELDRASDLSRQNVNRYEKASADPAYEWFMWCGANKHQDLDEAWSALQDAYKIHFTKQRAQHLINLNRFYYNLFKGDLKQLVADLKEQVKRTGNETEALDLIVYSDRANDTETRDQTLALLNKGKTKPDFSSALAKILEEYFKSEKYEPAQIKELLRKNPQDEETLTQINHRLIIARLNHEGEESHESIKRYLAKKIHDGNMKSRDRVMHHLTLVELGENPMYSLNAVNKAKWTRVKAGEMTEEQIAREEEQKKLLRERVLKARNNDYIGQKKKAREAKKKEAAKKEAAKQAAPKKEAEKAK